MEATNETRRTLTEELVRKAIAWGFERGYAKGVCDAHVMTGRLYEACDKGGVMLITTPTDQQPHATRFTATDDQALIEMTGDDFCEGEENLMTEVEARELKGE